MGYFLANSKVYEYSIMKKIVLIFLFLPFISFGQFDYKSYNKAVKYNSKGNIKKAIKYAYKSLEDNPSWRKPNLLLASIYINLDSIELAANFILKVYDRKNPKDVVLLEKLIKLYYSNGYYYEALSFLDIVLTDSLKMNFNVKRYINNCNFAIEAIKNPVTFNPQNIGLNINSSDQEYSPSISVDGSKLVYSRRFLKDNILQEDFYISYRDSDGNWKESFPLSDVLNTSGNEGAFSFSTDTNLIVFTSCERFDRVGGCDLYLLYDGVVYNAGNLVNSDKWDTQGCFSPDRKYLYFVSNRPGGFGGSDIWRSEIVDNIFLKPENLGPSINTKYDEMSPFLHPDNLTFYFASNGHIGMGDFDIFVSRRKNIISNWQKPENLGYPINSHNTENSLVVEKDGNTAYFVSNKNSYGLEDIFIFQLPNQLMANKITNIELDIITKQKNEEIIFKNVTFASNSFIIDSSSYLELDQLVAYLIKNPDLEIEIQGHTDDQGNDLDNLKLSISRAYEVFKYLQTRTENKLTYVGYGEQNPLFPNNSIQNRAKNRRTSFVIIN